MDIKSRLDKENYAKRVKKAQPKSPLWSELLRAFVVGGLICVAGEALTAWGKSMALDEELSSMFRTTVLVFLGALFTGIGIYDLLGKWAGAGSIVPITGFANSVVSPAIEFRTEGIVLGVGAKLFTIAGPVLVFGITASVAYGLIYYLVTVALA